jgi:predicted HicB family RNase H-like nuclease
MAKKRMLSDAIKALNAHAELSVAEADPEHSSTSLRPPSRQGKKTIAGHFDPAVSRQLREIALAEDSSVQELLREALNDLFLKRGRPPIA